MHLNSYHSNGCDPIDNTKGVLDNDFKSHGGCRAIGRVSYVVSDAPCAEMGTVSLWVNRSIASLLRVRFPTISRSFPCASQAPASTNATNLPPFPIRDFGASTGT